MAIHKAKIVTITSVKGGTGKTTTALNLAGIFSLLEKRVLIIDLDLYAGAVATSLNVSNENDLYKLIDDLNNNRFLKIEDYLSKYNEFIDILPAPKDPRFANKINSKYLNIVFNQASPKYDVILIDTNHLLSEINLVALDASDEIIYILSNDPIDLKNMKSVLAIFKENEITNYTVILNESINTHKDIFTVFDIKNIIDNNINWVISRHFHLPQIDKWVLAGDIPLLSKKIQRQKKSDYKRFSKIALSLINDKKGEIKDE